MIFLDVGAHEGQTLEEVTKPRYAFDRIFAFEPMPEQFVSLRERFEDDPSVTLLMVGLSDRAGVFPVYGDNSRMEASIYPTKLDVDESIVTNCAFVCASAFFRDVIPNDERVIVKLNCEGSEIAILDDLIDSGEVWKIENLMIDFDIRKVRGREKEEDRILSKFAAIGFDRYFLSHDVMLGETHQERIAHWLASGL